MALRECRRWCGGRTNLEKTLLSISVLFFITLILVILFGISYKGSSVPESTEEKVCNSKECIKTAGEMLTMMDFSVDPCSDFYSYSCGGYDHRLAASSVAQTSVDAVYALLRKELESQGSNDRQASGKAKLFYDACKNVDSYPKDPATVVENLMTEGGMKGWPVLDLFYDESKVTLEEKLTALSLIGVDVAFRHEIVPDPQKAGAYISKIFSVSESEEDWDNTKFRSYIKSVLVLLGLAESKASTEMSDIMSVYSYFIKNIQKKVSCGPPDLKETLQPQESLNEMNRLMPGVDWSVIMNGLWRAADLKGPLTVEIHCREKIKDYIQHLSDTSPRTINNYLGWRYLFPFAGQLGPSFLKLQSEYVTGEEGRLQPLHRAQWRQCLGVLERYMAPLLLEILSSKKMDEKVAEEIERITTNVKKILESSLTSIPWLSGALDKRIKQKVAAVKFKMPSWNSSGNDDWISQLEVESGPFVRNVIRLQKLSVLQQMRNHLTGEDPLNYENAKTRAATISKQQTRDHVTGGDPLKFNEFSLTTPKTFHSKDNTLGLYLDKIREPYLRIDQPSSLSYGGFGTFLGQQLSWYLLNQHVDSYAGDHALVWDMWASTKNASSCILNKFSEYLPNDKNIKEFLTKELFVDYNSLQLSHSAFKNNENTEQSLPGFEFFSEQMFFLAYSQTFCEEQRPPSDVSNIPTRVRVNSALGDLEAFSRAFSCGRSTAMNPLQRCHLWR